MFVRSDVWQQHRTLTPPIMAQQVYIQRLQQLIAVYPNVSKIYANSNYSNLFWREKDAQAYIKRTGDPTSSLSNAQIITIIN